jgi:hypothetical protein
MKPTHQLKCNKYDANNKRLNGTLQAIINDCVGDAMKHRHWQLYTWLLLYVNERAKALGEAFIKNGWLYGWTGQESSSGFCDLAPSILHYNWF